MKRLVATFCILLIVFNSVEYYALILLAQKQLTEQVMQKIETNSNELGGNLILAIPLELPYPAGSEEYTATEGEFVYQGELYRMVKQKFYKEMLYIVCMRDDQNAKRIDATVDYTQAFSGAQSERANSSIKMFNSLSKDYLTRIHELKRPTPIEITIIKPELSNLYGYEFTSSPFRPPQFS